MVSYRKPLVAVAALVGTLAFAFLPVSAADVTLRGIVRDPAKEPIAGATVIATNVATRASVVATTGADGAYSFALPPGAYSVRATSARFQGPAETVHVETGGPAQHDFTLMERVSEVVVVTATKGPATPFDVPFSVAARTGQDLEDRGVTGIEDLAANVGSFSVQNLGPGQSQVAMRGVSSGQIARDQPGVKEQVGIYLDESPVSMSLFTPDLEMVDVDRVEVLRGPQGTLFGAGSDTGAVRYVTRQPLMGVTEGFAEVGGGIVESGSPAGTAKAGLNIPLTDTSALRLVGYYTHTPGFTDAVQPDFSTDDDVNDGFRTGARVAATFAPGSDWTITPRIVYQRVETNGWNLEDIYNILANPFTTTRPPVRLDDQEEFTQLGESFVDDFLMGDVNLRYNFGPVELTSVTSVIDRDVHVVRDTTALSASFTGGNLGLPEPVYTLDSPLFDNTHSKLYTQELRLAGGTSRAKWLGGVFYSHARREYGQDVKIFGFTDATGIPTQGQMAPKDSIYFSRLAYDLDQTGLFGEATFRLTERLDLTGGLRWYHYDEDKSAKIDGVFGNPGGFPGPPLSLPGSVSADGLAPRLIAAYRVSDNAILNAQVSRGFRLGGINDPINTVVCSPQDLVTFGHQDTWDDETVWNYEAGIKSMMNSGRVSLDAALFYMDIDDLQTTVTAGTCTSRLVFNVPRARSRGVELELGASPGRHWDLSLSTSANDSELRSTVTSTDASGNVSVVSGIEKGRRLPSVPRFQAALAGTYRIELSSNARMHVTGVYQHVGSRYTQVGDQDLGTLDLTTFGPNAIGGPPSQNTFHYDPKLPAYDLVNLRFAYERNAWNIEAYVNNLTNELALLSLDRERGTLARIGFLTNQPRTFGVSTGYKF